jgi:hypothetical protein
MFFFHRHDYLLNNEKENFGVDFKKVLFPSDQEFVLPEFSYSGYPQVSLASKDVCFN